LAVQNVMIVNNTFGLADRTLAAFSLGRKTRRAA